MNIHEYANELIWTFEYHMESQHLSFHLVSTFLVFDEHKLRYDEFTMYTVVFQYKSAVAMETVRFHIAQMSFFMIFFFLAFNGSQWTIWHPREIVLWGV